MQTQMWHNMFVLGLPIGEKILRPVVVYAFLIVGLRLAGSASWPSSIRSIWWFC